MEFSNGIALVQVADKKNFTGLLIKSEINGSQFTVTGAKARMTQITKLVTARAQKGFSFEVLRDYAQHLIKQANKGAL